MSSEPHAEGDDEESSDGWLGERPRDRLVEDLVLQRLESRLLDREPAVTMLSRYVLLRCIGSGGLGRVYEAYDPQLDRKLAIKVLHDLGDGTQAQQRLLREGQALARLAHPHVVAVHDVGVIDHSSGEGGAQLFVAMELVDGLTLGDWIAERPHRWQEIRDVLVQAGRGLAAAHEAGLVHRDVKPANVLVGRDGRARVVDFGLARSNGAVEQAATVMGRPLDQSITAAGMMLGTPAYMAPEQIAGTDVGPLADQFSLCVTAYEALFGRRPFEADDVADLLVAITRCVPRPPPAGTQVPKWLSAAVLRGLAREPTARFGTIGELLDAMLEDQRVRRRRRGLALAGFVALAISGAAVVVATRPDPTPEELALVERLTDESRAAAARSAFVIPPLDDPDAPTAYRKVRELETQRGAIDELAEDRAQELRREYAAMLVALGDAYAEREGGAGFASDFYAAALVFDPEHAHARARTTLSPGELHALAEQAERGEFSIPERVAGESLAVLAEVRHEDRQVRARALLARADGPAPSTGARLRVLVGAPEIVGVDASRDGGASRPPTAAPSPPPATSASLEVRALDEATSGLGDPPAMPERAESDDAREPDRLGADALVAEAARAEASGGRQRARELLHRALQLDRKHAAALAALAHSYFEAAAYHQAIRFAERAVAVAPRRAEYRIALGDAHFRVLAYDAARDQYRRAAELGHPSATRRLALLDGRTGGSRPR